MNDDAYESFNCQNSFWRHYHVSIAHADGGNIFLGVSRIVAFILFFSFNWYNRILLSKRAGDNINVIKGLVLPSYFTYIYIYIALSLMTGILDLIIEKGSDDAAKENVWLIPIETGLYHWLYEGLAFFLMRYGAGVKAIYRSLSYSFAWGVITMVLYFFLVSILTSQYGFTFDSDNAYSVFLAYQLLLLCFYGSFLIVPIDYLYRRPALVYYAKFNVLYYILSSISGSLLFQKVEKAVCPCSVIVFVFVAIVQPIVIFKTLQIDSQYWQGLNCGGGESNPLADVWDHVGIDTAKSMAEDLEKFDHSPIKLPILHFGLIHFDTGGDFVAGGFSRVYFGKLRSKAKGGAVEDQRVAFKILFAMELTPGDVKEFYREATILYNLRHENVVQCKGVCVMPPSLTLVLEFCLHGSLFDFLYKPRKAAPTDPYFERASTATIMLRQTNMNRISEVVGTHHYGGNNNNNNSSTLSMNPIVVSTVHSTAAHQHHAASRESECKDSGSDRDSSHQRASMFSVHTVESYSGDSIRSSTSETGSSQMSMSSRIASKTSRALGASISTLISTTNSLLGRPNIEEPPVGSSSLSVPILHSSAFFVSLRQRIKMMRDAVNAISFLHSKGYMHCDIKSLNFLVTEDLVVKLADMGEARLVNSPPKRDIPPIPARNWAPPEVLVPGARADSYTVKSDIYGLCIVLSELMLLELPFGDTPDRVSVQKWHSMLTQDYLRPVLPSDPLVLSPKLKKMIEQGWLSYPSMRPPAEDILAAVDDFIAQQAAADSNPNNSMYAPTSTTDAAV